MRKTLFISILTISFISYNICFAIPAVTTRAVPEKILNNYGYGDLICPPGQVRKIVDNKLVCVFNGYGIKPINYGYGELIKYGYGYNNITNEQKRIEEWKNAARKQIEQIDKEIKKLEERKMKINKELEEKILGELNKNKKAYGAAISDEITNVSYTISNGYSGRSSVFNINKSGEIKITEANIRSEDTNALIITGKLNREEFNNLKNLITKANIFTLEDSYKCIELCPTDMSDITSTFTIGNNTKTITITPAVKIPEGLSNINNELVRLQDKFRKENTNYGINQMKKETFINKTVDKIKNMIKK